MIFLCKINEKVKKYSLVIIGILCGAVNGLFGSGGGMIAVPALEQSGIEAKKAHATSIAITAALSVVSAALYFSKDSVNLSQAMNYIPLGLAGAAVGAKILKKIPTKLLHKIFGIFMIAAGFRIFL